LIFPERLAFETKDLVRLLR